ncbi:type II toxin-antitoxin system toxin DNA ADP-ribosyl transferase DarT [Micromonospora sp. NBC_01813]|uniref:type II toxin-antitoxin system toxin DNA ADP-ribosyl transferase DarT n=1 Tax=Micromonospora sp. NBC_01813 TaxID=2975988 RepID=UPI002DDBF92B|nr:DUF4433 domain-containing protein [Micromonospora sp. NBC_01813]WSA08910.1 DUF4433 domain-containing protein [Micromonospora sp. NBC_01813]
MSPAESTSVRNRWILHFTHIDNLAGIAAAGRLACDVSARAGLTRAEVGDPAIKESRRRRQIPVGPRGYVGDYVPFYYAPRSPMMYRIACDHRDSVAGRYADGDRPLIYLAATVGAVVDAGATWVATDGNAANATSAFTTALDDLDGMVDWPLMHAERWNSNTDDPDRQRRRMAEFLVHHEVPLAGFHQVAAYSSAHAARAQVALGDHPLAKSVVVRPTWYYGFQRVGG